MNNAEKNFIGERSSFVSKIDPRVLRYRTRRDVLLFGAGALTVLAGAGALLPPATLGRLGLHRNVNPRGKEWLLNKALRIDDDVAEALYSKNRIVPTYTKSQITRFVCVEGWSAVAWWAGLRFDNLLRAYPPMSQAKWARVESSVNLDASGNPDPYFVSIDLATARHPQTLLATHHDGQPLTVEHGAPLRLLVPVKLGLKNVKAITRITYSAEEPKDYWEQYGYSSYDGI